LKIKLNVISAHITALIAGAFSVIALVHPGFKEPAVVQGIGVALPIVLSGAIEAYHLLTHRQIQAAIAVAEATAQNVQAATTPVPTAAQGTPAATA
jgi:hypothetical protein